jgi:hypothetical protein
LGGDFDGDYTRNDFCAVYFPMRWFLHSSMLLSLIFFSCNNPNEKIEKQIVKPSYIDSLLCENQLSLISNDTIPLIELNFEKSTGSCIRDVQNALNSDLCDEKVYFAIPFDLKSMTLQNTVNSIPLKLRITKQCDIWCGDGIRIIKFLINSKGDVLVDSNPYLEEELSTAIDSLIEFKYLRAKFPLIEKSSSHILINWREGVNSNKLTRQIYHILFGYLHTVDVFAQTKFNKSVCELSAQEMNLIHKRIPFELELDSYEEILPIEKISEIEQ